ncbi:unnamed protein product, partial [Nesidiocoris tenuis]
MNVSDSGIDETVRSSRRRDDLLAKEVESDLGYPDAQSTPRSKDKNVQDSQVRMIGGKIIKSKNEPAGSKIESDPSYDSKTQRIVTREIFDSHGKLIRTITEVEDLPARRQVDSTFIDERASDKRQSTVRMIGGKIIKPDVHHDQPAGTVSVPTTEKLEGSVTGTSDAEIRSQESTEHSSESSHYRATITSHTSSDTREASEAAIQHTDKSSAEAATSVATNISNEAAESTKVSLGGKVVKTLSKLWGRSDKKKTTEHDKKVATEHDKKVASKTADKSSNDEVIETEASSSYEGNASQEFISTEIRDSSNSSRKIEGMQQEEL